MSVKIQGGYLRKLQPDGSLGPLCVVSSDGTDISGGGGGGGLTDTQLRATPVPVSQSSLPLPTGAAKDSTLTDGTQRVGGTVAVSGPLTDTQLRATPVPVSQSSLPLPTGAAKDSTLTDGTQRVGGTVAVSSADNVTTGTIVASGGTVTAAAISGMGTWFMAYYGTYATGPSLTMEVSFDGGATYVSVRMLQETSAILGYVTTIATGANAINSFVADIPTGATHLRARASAFGASGTINIVLGQSPSRSAAPPAVLTSIGLISAITPGVTGTALGKAEDAASASGDTGVFVLGVRNDAQAAATNADGDYTQQSHDARGALRINPASFAFANISTVATTTVKSGVGELHAITVNSKGTVASTITVYDNTAGSGAKIATIDSLNQSGTMVYNVAFANGLTLVTTGTVAPDVTVSYR